MELGEPVRVHVELDAAVVGFGGESFWARPVLGRDAVFVVDNVLLFAPFGCGDLVSARSSGGSWHVVELLERSPRSSVMVAVTPPGGGDGPVRASDAAVSSALKAGAAVAADAGASVAASLPNGFVVVWLPPEAVDSTVSSQSFPGTVEVVERVLAAVDAVLMSSGAGLAGCEVLWSPVACPGDPVGVVAPMTGLVSASVVVADDGYRVDGADLDMWCAAFAAIQEEFFTSVPVSILLGLAQKQYVCDERVRAEVASGRCDDSAMLVWRGLMAAHDQVLPVLPRPLFDGV